MSDLSKAVETPEAKVVEGKVKSFFESALTDLHSALTKIESVISHGDVHKKTIAAASSVNAAISQITDHPSAPVAPAPSAGASDDVLAAKAE